MTGSRDVLDRVAGLRALLIRQSGLARRDQLRLLGVSDAHIRSQCAAGRWREVSPTVVAADNGRLDADQLEWRAVLHPTTGWLGGRSALARHGLRGYGPEAIHVLVPRDHRPDALDGVVQHVTGRPPALSAAHAIPTTTSARAAVDACAWEPAARAAAGLVLAVVQQRICTVAEVLAELEAAGRVRHRRVVRDALDEAAAGAESLAEADVVRLVRRAGLPEPRRQVRSVAGRHDLAVDLPDGRILVLEVDGPQHETAEARWQDARRDAALTARGIITVRIPVFAVRHDPDEGVRRLRAVAFPEQVATASMWCGTKSAPSVAPPLATDPPRGGASPVRRQA